VALAVPQTSQRVRGGAARDGNPDGNDGNLAPTPPHTRHRPTRQDAGRRVGPLRLKSGKSAVRPAHRTLTPRPCRRGDRLPLVWRHATGGGACRTVTWSHCGAVMCRPRKRASRRCASSAIAPTPGVAAEQQVPVPSASSGTAGSQKRGVEAVLADTGVASLHPG